MSNSCTIHVECINIKWVTRPTLDAWMHLANLATIQTTFQELILGWRSDRRFGLGADLRVNFEQEWNIEINGDPEIGLAPVGNGNPVLVPVNVQNFPSYTQRSEDLTATINALIGKIESVDYDAVAFRPEAERIEDGFFNWRLLNEEARKQTLRYLNTLKNLNEEWHTREVLINMDFFDEEQDLRLDDFAEQEAADLVAMLDSFILFVGNDVWLPGDDSEMLEWIFTIEDRGENPVAYKVNFKSSSELVEGINMLAAALTIYEEEIWEALKNAMRLLPKPTSFPTDPIIEETIVKVRRIVNFWQWYAEKLVTIATAITDLTRQMQGLN
ncbi:hypothetical protein ABW20_dc0106859 [Dactylellina cionopaga]|nr:hypothetical protein ABW20_dc0106859 [Dactylellina cionopaga]